MAQRTIVESGQQRLLIEVSIRCKNHPSGRITRKRRFDNVEINSKKAVALEKELLKEVQLEKAQREVLGISWEALLNLYEVETLKQVQTGQFVQNKQTFNEAIRALHKWTSEWNPVIASKISCADVTRLFHRMKESGISDSTLGKIRSDIKKVFDFGILHYHVCGIDRSPTVGVSIRSRKRMRTEILSDEEIKKLLLYGRQYEPTWFYIWSFAIYTGARNGELYALKWTDLDEKDQIITIQRSFNASLGEYKGTKTDEWRKVSICKPLQEIIQELKAIREHDLARGESKYPDFVLPRPGLWQNGEQARVLRQFCEEIGITPICFHTLRACFATELLKRGVPVPRVMRVGGWKSVKTMMHYVRLAGIEDKGITDPLDFRSSVPDMKAENQILMDTIGEKYGTSQGNHSEVASVIPLASRRHPRVVSS